jgi:hypothetical protein
MIAENACEEENFPFGREADKHMFGVRRPQKMSLFPAGERTHRHVVAEVDLQFCLS